MEKQFHKHLKQLEAQIPNLMPGHSVDCVIFGYEDQKLKVLLLKWKGEELWALPGGFIRKDEVMDEAAHRVLAERTGLKSVFLNQFFTFSGLDRSQSNIKPGLISEIEVLSPLAASWFNSRFFTTAYFAFADIKQAVPKPDMLSDSCSWVSLSELPELILDHKEILDKALEHLRIRLNYLPIGHSLLSEEFTMADLQKLYEAILGKKLERSNFQRKILKLGMLIRGDKQMSGGAHKAPYLYSIDNKRYEELLKEGIGFTP